MSKPRSDSHLLTLNPDRQRQIIDWLKTGSQNQTIKLIREQFGVHTSSAALSHFYAWWHVANPLNQIGQFIREYDQHQTNSDPLPAQIDKLLNLALGNLARQVNLNPDPGLLTTLVKLRLDLRKAEREDTKLTEAMKLTRWKVDNENADRQLAGKYRTQADRELNQMKKQFKQDLRAQAQQAKATGSSSSSPTPSSETLHSALRTPNSEIQPSTIHHPPTREPDFSGALSAAILAASASDTNTPISESPTSCSSSSSWPSSSPPPSPSLSPPSSIPPSEAKDKAPTPAQPEAGTPTHHSTRDTQHATPDTPHSTPSALPTPSSDESPSAAPPYPTLDPKPLPPFFQKAEECLVILERALGNGEYRFNYRNVSDKLREHLWAIRSHIAAVTVASRHTTAQRPANSLDLNLVFSLADEASRLAYRFDVGLRHPDQRPHLNRPLIPILQQIRGPLCQLTQILGLPTPDPTP